MKNAKHLFIIDNQKAYSDHTIYFVEAAGWYRPAAEALCRLLSYPEDPPGEQLKIIGEGDIEFEGTAMTMTKFIDMHSYRASDWAQPEHIGEARRIARVLPRTAFKDPNLAPFQVAP